MGLPAGDDSGPEVRLAGGGADRGGYGAGGDPGEVAQQRPAIETIGLEPFGQGEHDLPVRHRASRVSSSQRLQRARRLAWQLGQK